MFFRNLILIIAVYIVFLGIAYRILPYAKLTTFIFFVLPGVMWALADAADLSAVGRKRAAAIWGGFAAVMAASCWFLALPFWLNERGW